MTATDITPLRFRSPLARFVGWAWFVFAALNGVDLLARGSGREAVAIGCGLAFVTAAVWALSFRPVVIGDSDGVLLRNPVRDVFVPWPLIDGIEASANLDVLVGERRYRAWAIGSARRDLRRPPRPGADAASTGYAQELTPLGFAAEQLCRLREERRRAAAREVGAGGAERAGAGSGGVEVRPVWTLIAVLATTALATVVLTFG